MASVTVERTNGAPAVLEFRPKPADLARAVPRQPRKVPFVSSPLIPELDLYYDCLAAMEEEAGAARRG